MSSPWTLTGLQTARNDLLERGAIYITVEHPDKARELDSYLEKSKIKVRWTQLDETSFCVSFESAVAKVVGSDWKGVVGSNRRKPSKDLRATDDQIERYKRQRDAGS